MNITRSIQQFKSYIDSNSGIAKPNRFAVEIRDNVLMNNVRIQQPHIYLDVEARNTYENIIFSARSASIPTKTISTNPVEAPGPEQKYPYNDVYDDITVTFMATQGAQKNSGYGIPERRFFDAWMNMVVDQSTMLVNYSNVYSTDLFFISLLNERSELLAKYQFDRVYPIGMGAIELSHDSEDFATFDVTFSCDRWHYVLEHTKSTFKDYPPPKTTNDQIDQSTIWNTKDGLQKKKLLDEPKKPLFKQRESEIKNFKRLDTTPNAIPKRWRNSPQSDKLLESDKPHFIKPDASGVPDPKVKNLKTTPNAKAQHWKEGKTKIQTKKLLSSDAPIFIKPKTAGGTLTLQRARTELKHLKTLGRKGSRTIKKLKKFI